MSQHIRESISEARPIKGWRILPAVSIIAVSVVTYLPAIGNSFISDDFTMLPFVRMLETHPGCILDNHAEIFRSVSYIYFGLCLKAFGSSSEAFYSSGIALHAIVSLLVGRLVLILTRDSRAAWMAGLFFVAYERHQEAVMWISAANDVLLTLFSLIFLILWERSLDNPEGRWSYSAALVWFPVALFSKEAAVAMPALAVLRMVSRGYLKKEIFLRAVPLVLMLGGYVAIWLSEVHSNSFVTGGFYAFGPHFFPVYVQSLLRVLSPTLLALIPLAFLGYRGSRLREVSALLGTEASLFFAVFAGLTIVPYAFLTYLNQIPSRNTYLPSVGLAALMGVLLSGLYNRFTSARFKPLYAGFLIAIIAGNSAYIRLRKVPQFKARAAPTRELISMLNGPVFRDHQTAPIHVCGFPLDPFIGRDAIEEFTRFSPGEVTFPDRCGSDAVNILDWSAGAETYVRRASNVYSAPAAASDSGSRMQGLPQEPCNQW